MTADQYPDGIHDDDPAFDPTISHQARYYNYLLGGKDHYAADRAFARKVMEVYPDMPAMARANRAFLGRAVRYLAGEAGISQFLDIGAGLPAPGSTHEVAQQARPGSRVVYADLDPVVLAHSRAFMTGQEPGAVAYIDADLRQPGPVLARAAETLDFTRPVGLLLIAVLHVIGDEDGPFSIVATLMDALPSGSYLAVTHWAVNPANEHGEDTLKGLVREQSRQQYAPRPREEITRFFSGLELLDPGLVPLQYWRPDPGDQPADSSLLWAAGVARKP